MTHCQGPFSVHHLSFATLNYREPNQSIYGAKVSVVSLKRGVTYGWRLNSQFEVFIDFLSENGCHYTVHHRLVHPKHQIHLFLQRKTFCCCLGKPLCYMATLTCGIVTDVIGWENLVWHLGTTKIQATPQKLYKTSFSYTEQILNKNWRLRLYVFGGLFHLNYFFSWFIFKKKTSISC